MMVKPRKYFANPINSRGMSVMEVLVAMVIFSISFTAVLYVLNSTERIKSRQRMIAYSAIVAQNDIEAFRSEGSSAFLVGDSTYETVFNEVTFAVTRQVLPPDTNTQDLQEIEVLIQHSPDLDTIGVYRVLQGNL